MADKLKNFFKNKKADSRFKKAGPGYRLDETPSQSLHSSKSSNSSSYQPAVNRSGLTQESRQAAAAALARLDKKKNDNSPFNTSLAAIKAQVRRELEAEKKQAAAAIAQPKSIPQVELESSPLLAVQGVYFQCPLLGPDILTREEWNQKIRDFLYEQLEEEKGLTACLIIHTLNRSKEKKLALKLNDRFKIFAAVRNTKKIFAQFKPLMMPAADLVGEAFGMNSLVDACIETISKYFENIIKNPSDDKYRKIRISNKVYQEKVNPVEGAFLLLEAAGFEVKQLPYQDTVEDFLVFPAEKLPEAIETFEILLDGLRNAEPITLELHRNLQVLLPSQARERNELPDSFFNLTVEEIKREQMLRTEAVERNQMLRTKAMRERDEIREIRKYKFALIRIRFPDGIFLQGTFGVYEKIPSILEFVREALDEEDLSFTLTAPNGHHLTENSEATLFDEKLVPAALLIFTTKVSRQTFLKPEVLMLVESLTLS